MIKKYIIDISTIILSGFTLFPILTGNNMIRIAVLFSFIAVLYFSYSEIKKAKDIPFKKIVIVFVLSLIISYAIGIKHSINFFIHIGVCLIFIPIYIFYRKNNYNRMEFVVVVITVLLIISSFQTIQMLDIDASFARHLSKNQDDIFLHDLSGGYGLVYAAVLAFFAIINTIVNSRYLSKYLRLLFVLASVSFLILIWKAGFFLALVIIALGAFMLLIGINKRKLSKTILLLVASGTIFIVFKPVVEGFTKELIQGTKYYEKVDQILSSDKEMNLSGGEFETRHERYSRDLKLLIDYPIIGCWDRLKVGKHSFILDTLAQYGLIFGSYFIYFLFFIPFRFIKESEGLAYSQSFTFIGATFLFLLLNSLSMSIAPIIFIIYPYTNYLLRKNQ